MAFGHPGAQLAPDFQFLFIAVDSFDPHPRQEHPGLVSSLPPSTIRASPLSGSPAARAPGDEPRRKLATVIPVAEDGWWSAP
jgi:hypothetical protein